MSDARISFAIPFYRGLDYLRVAIDSVLEQSVADWQLLVCDDGAVDPGAEQLVAGYRDPRLSYHVGPAHLGMVRNWNRCLELADTDLVTLLHADDRALPDYARQMLGLASDHPSAAAFFCGAQIIDARGVRRFSLADAVKRLLAPRGPEPMLLKGEAALRALMAGNFIMCPTLCFRRSVLGRRVFDTEWQQVQDLELTTRLLFEAETLVGTRRVAYAYRRHAGAATARQSESLLRFEEEDRLFNRVADHAEAMGWHDAARVSRRRNIVKLHLAYRTLRELALLRPGRAHALLRFLVTRW